MQTNITAILLSTPNMACTQGSTLFQPATQWTQDTNDHILRVCLPGFQKDEFKVQVDNCGKLTIRGKRPLGDGKYMRLEQVFDVPKDSHIDKIRGKFEDARLSLFMPKKVVTEKETQRAVSCDKKEKQETPPAPSGKQEEAQTQKDQQKEKPSTDAQPGPIPEQKPNSGPVADDKLEEYKKKALAWKVKFEEQLEGWLDYGLIDGFLETISKNKKTIAVATAAFTAGFYISRKLRSS